MSTYTNKIYKKDGNDSVLFAEVNGKFYPTSCLDSSKKVIDDNGQGWFGRTLEEYRIPRENLEVVEGL